MVSKSHPFVSLLCCLISLSLDLWWLSLFCLLDTCSSLCGGASTCRSLISSSKLLWRTLAFSLSPASGWTTRFLLFDYADAFLPVWPKTLLTRTLSPGLEGVQVIFGGNWQYGCSGPIPGSLHDFMCQIFRALLQLLLLRGIQDNLSASVFAFPGLYFSSNLKSDFSNPTVPWSIELGSVHYVNQKIIISINGKVWCIL